MNIAQLRTFVTVVDHGSFSEAARTMGISQPAVTMQVQALESDVGATLLDRRYRRVDLTEAGRALMPYARRILDELEEAREEITSLTGVVTGRLHIAASTTPGVYVVPRLLGGFLSDHVEVGVTITVHDTADVVSAVESGEAQLGITGAEVRGARVGFEEMGTDELIVIASPKAPFASKRCKLADLAEEAWVMRESGSGTRQVAEKVLAENGVDAEGLRVVTELGTGEAIVSAVEGGLGVSIVSRYVAEKALKLGTVVALDTEGTPATRPFFAVTPRGTLTRAAEAFLDVLRAELGS
ncbi:MAG: LysR family transcriptional regulator [Coriobacteriales bacterium]|nr:LysR family transcriptional regulator [Coriobacteriales bacterium]